MVKRPRKRECMEAAKIGPDLRLRPLVFEIAPVWFE